MPEEELELAVLTPDQVERIQELERRLGGAYVLAFRKPAAKPNLAAGVPLAELTEEQAGLLAETEAVIGDVLLLAFRAG